MKYQVEFDTMNDGMFFCWYCSDKFENVIKWAEEELKTHGGGHADIIDEDDALIGSTDI